MRKIILISALCLHLNNASAMAVFDASVFGQAIAQVQSMGQQLTEMKTQVQNSFKELDQLKQTYDETVKVYDQAKETYNAANGLTNMKSLQDIGSAARQYLPTSASGLTSNYGNSESIKSASKLLDVNDTTLKNSADATKIFNDRIQQQSTALAQSQAAYERANKRYADFQDYIDSIGETPTEKQKQDLQNRIQSEQLMMQNEQNQLMVLAQIREANKDILQQQQVELSLQSTRRKTTPRF